MLFTALYKQIIMACMLLFVLPAIVLNGNPDYFQAPQLSVVDNAVFDEMLKQEIVGCAVGVVKNGEVVHLKGYGHQDKLRTKPITKETVYRWASISKTVTAVAAWQLIENEKFLLNSKVWELVPYWSKKKEKDEITVQHLFNHRSGINHYDEYKEKKYDSHDEFDAKQSVSVFEYADLDFTPGTKHQYSTFGYNLLGAVVDEQSPNGYVKWINQHIEKPLGISLSIKPVDHGGFEKDCNGKLGFIKEGDVLWKLPGGGFGSDIGGLTGFMQGLINKKLLRFTQLMWTNVANNSNYCFGLKTDPGPSNELRVGHGGAQDDVRTMMFFYPDSKNGVALMINGGDYVDEDRMIKVIEKAAFGTKWNISDKPLNYCPVDDDGKTECNGKGDNMIAIGMKVQPQEVIMRRNYNKNEFLAEKNWMISHGYYPFDVETYQEGAERKWDALFRKISGNKSVSIIDKTITEFNVDWKANLNQNILLTDIETCMDNGVRKWAGCFEQGDGVNSFYYDMTEQEFLLKNKEMLNAESMLIDIEIYYIGSKQTFTGVWKKQAANNIHVLNKSYNDFLVANKENLNNGFRLIDVESYMEGSTRKWAGIWEKKDADRFFISDDTYCEFVSKYTTYQSQGFKLIDIEKY